MNTKLNTLLLLLGKAFIAISFLCPIPFDFIPHIFVGCNVSMAACGTSLGYWWPLLRSLALGFMLCVLSKHTSKHIPEEPLDIEHSPLAVTGGIITLGVVLIIVILALIFFIIGIYYAFFSEYMPIVLPICIGVGIVSYLLYIGWKCYHQFDND